MKVGKAEYKRRIREGKEGKEERKKRRNVENEERIGEEKVKKCGK